MWNLYPGSQLSGSYIIPASVSVGPHNDRPYIEQQQRQQRCRGLVTHRRIYQFIALTQQPNFL